MRQNHPSYDSVPGSDAASQAAADKANRLLAAKQTVGKRRGEIAALEARIERAARKRAVNGAEPDAAEETDARRLRAARAELGSALARVAELSADE